MARDQGADEAREYEPGQPGMYELEFPAPQLSSSDGRGPVLVHALEGFSDAGHAIRLAAAHLKAALDTELVASFAIDELLDYRSRRPLMTFKTDHFTHSDDPELSLYALRDSIGTPFLLLAGLEPDLKWERFITAVRLLAERLGVRQTIGLGTVPMAVPHTRPITMTAHSNNRELISDFQPSISEIQVPVALPTYWNTGWPSTVMRSSGSPCTSRTISRRPTIPRPPKRCSNKWPRPVLCSCRWPC